jgi:glycogen synthase
MMNFTRFQPPQRILMTADTVGGVWSYAMELARALELWNVNVALAAMGGRLTREQRKEVRKLRNTRVFESCYKLEWMEKPWLDLARAGEWLMGIERQVRPDVVHLNNYVHAALAFRAPKIVVGHSCVLSWWQAVKGVAAPAQWDWYGRQVARGLRAAHLVVAPTRSMMDALQVQYGPLPATEVIPNGRDAGPYVPLSKETFVLSAGRLWDEAKNAAALAEIAPELEWPVFMAGEVKHPDQGVVEKSGVAFLGRLSSSAMASWYGRAAIYALPARYEPFGLSVLEAGLAGCALVLGDIPSLRENWEGAAVFVSPGEKGALKAALEEMINSSRAREEFGRRARVRALEFTPQRMAVRYMSAYGDLMLIHGVRERGMGGAA